MTRDEGAGLKCVIAWSARRRLGGLMAEGLASLADAGDIRRLGDEACLVYSPAPADAIRDRLRERLEEGESLLVLEFEKWSGYGRAVDAAWLLARGH